MLGALLTVRDLVEHAARARPDAVYALEAEGSHSITQAQLAASCRRVSAWLGGLGCARGDTVSLVMPNGLGTLQWLLGAMHGGRVVNPVNLLSSADQMRYVIGHSDCKLVLATAEWADTLRGVLAQIERPIALQIVPADELQCPEATAAADDGAPDATDAALLMYTSGTTGVPKGVLLTHGNLVANAKAISAEHGLREGDRVLGVLPLYHINAFTVTMLAPLAHGGSLAMPPRFSAARFWAQAHDGACTWINVVPTMISYLLEGEVPPRAQTRALRFCRSASAALPPDHLRAFEARFGIGIIETMGLTETAAPSFSNPIDPRQRKLGAVGRASGCEARVVDAALVPLPDGHTGEITIRGPNVMKSYYKNDASTREAFTPDGWLRTGDLGHRDADGFFFVTGRIKELIIKGGENIAPRELDEVLLQHPAVLEAAVVGVPDPHYGQEILACIVLREGHAPAAAETALRAFCTERLGRYKAPKAYRFVRELPRGPSGKVQRLKLLDWPA
jgi:acyl-CoA synthetase (AMP-forming)/AMP-acid ligase II